MQKMNRISNSQSPVAHSRNSSDTASTSASPQKQHKSSPISIKETVTQTEAPRVARSTADVIKNKWAGSRENLDVEARSLAEKRRAMQEKLSMLGEKVKQQRSTVNLWTIALGKANENYQRLKSNQFPKLTNPTQDQIDSHLEAKHQAEKALNVEIELLKNAEFEFNRLKSFELDLYPEKKAEARRQWKAVKIDSDSEVDEMVFDKKDRLFQELVKEYGPEKAKQALDLVYGAEKNRK